MRAKFAGGLAEQQRLRLVIVGTQQPEVLAAQERLHPTCGGRALQAASLIEQRLLAARRQGLGYRTYVLLGDGEIQGGIVWEGAMAAAKFRVSSLTAILDYNDVQLDGAVHDIMPLEPLIDKWRAFNWAVLEINGHNLRQVLEALDTASEIHGRPTIIVAHTTKGKGVSFMEDRSYWHGVAPNAAQLAQATTELGRCV